MSEDPPSKRLRNVVDANYFTLVAKRCTMIAGLVLIDAKIHAIQLELADADSALSFARYTEGASSGPFKSRLGERNALFRQMEAMYVELYDLEMQYRCLSNHLHDADWKQHRITDVD